MAGGALVVDGTNVSWAWPRSRAHMIRRDYGSAQMLLVRALVESPLRAVHQELLIVFDGAPTPGGPSSSRGVLVLHPDFGRTADDRILELIGQRRHSGNGISLASSDRALRDAARALGATTMGALELLARLEGRPMQSGRSDRDRVPATHKPSPSTQDTEAWLRQFNASRTTGRSQRPQKDGDSR